METKQTFGDKQEFTEFITIKTTLQKIVMEVLQRERRKKM